MGNIVGRIDSRLSCIKFSNNNEVLLTMDMINAPIVSKYLTNNINNYGINTKISLLSLFTNGIFLTIIFDLEWQFFIYICLKP